MQTPTNGLFVWVELPLTEQGNQIDTTKLLKEAVEKENIAFIPGQAFAVPGKTSGQSTLRLNFSYSTNEQIKDGLKRLGRVISEF